MSVKAIVTDIEGTTSSISFVHEVLFPYAAQALPDYVRAHEGEHRDLIDAVRSEGDEPGADLERVIAILLGWIERDEKVTPLKALQGHIWSNGYARGDFTGHIYSDAVKRLRAWHDQGLRLYVYSSGSVKAQKLLFRHSDEGDLTPLFSGYFDTTTGPKRELASYEAIARAVNQVPGEILFLSDVFEELDAARAAGFQTMQLVRDEKVVVGDHATARDFDEVVI
ncbi:MAG: acireductone synthase [Myxococcota bacterium]